MSEPISAPAVGPAVVLLNAGIIHRVGPSRVGVELARALASAGYRVLRFDLSGIGDSAASADLASLADIVRGDIAEAINFIAPANGNGVVLFGICSGADNAFYVGAEDDRIVGLVLIDPDVHPTREFRIRDTWRKFTNTRSWLNVITGRYLMRRVRRRLSRDVIVRPPGYYGLLAVDQATAIQNARVMSGRGVHFLYVITGEHPFINYPGQISDSLEGAIPPRQLRVEWRQEADHLLRREQDRKWLADTMRSWLPRLSPAAQRGAA